jgi:hypothetical protein
MMDGQFEAHITVRCDDGAASATRLERWSAARGWKFTHIVLARGRTPSQPMLTLRGSGSYEEQLRTCHWASKTLSDAGFSPVRVKIEVPPWEPVVPRSDGEARLPDGFGGPSSCASRYFEHHLKVLLDPVGRCAAVCLDALTATAVAHDAHVSWNARRIRGGTGRQERFVTQRCHGVGLPAAQARLAALTRAVEDLSIEITEVEQEFVVYDSNTAIDEGWIVMMRDEAVRR